MSATVETFRLVLASSSPRRRLLLADAGFDFEVVAPAMAEPADLGGSLSPAGRAEALAYFKARSVADRYGGACVLGADTLVAAGGQVFGKPADRREAEAMLGRLAGTRHTVITGVALPVDGGFSAFSGV